MNEPTIAELRQRKEKKRRVAEARLNRRAALAAATQVAKGTCRPSSAILQDAEAFLSWLEKGNG